MKKPFAKYLQSNAKKALETRPFYGRESDAEKLNKLVTETQRTTSLDRALERLIE